MDRLEKIGFDWFSAYSEGIGSLRARAQSAVADGEFANLSPPVTARFS